MTNSGETGTQPDARVLVVGLGYVGLPLALSFAEAGTAVVGVDASAARVAELNAGHSPIDDVTDDRLAGRWPPPAGDRARRGRRCRRRRRVRLRADAGDGDQGPGPRPGAGRGGLRPGRASTGPARRAPVDHLPGTTAARSGRLSNAMPACVQGATSTWPSPPSASTRAIPQARVVSSRASSGASPQGSDRARRDTAPPDQRRVVELSSPDAAELAKVHENVFRNVNIALVNELALLCERMGLDVWEIIDAAATKPFGFMPFAPGPGVGGHCIPVDPYYLAWRARQFDFTDRFVELAADVNVGMPRHVVDLAAEALNDRHRPLNGARVGVLGVAFKANVGDARESPAAHVLAGLRGRGADVRFHDPHVPKIRDASGVEDTSVPLGDLLGWAELVLVVTPHRAIDWDAVFATAKLILDTVGVSRGRSLRPRQALRLGAGWSG